MVTTRSADKRNNTTQDDLALRSKAAQSPSQTSSTPTTSRKRATNHLHSPRSKRTRLGSEDAKYDGNDELSGDNLGTADLNEEKQNLNNTYKVSNEAPQQVQVIVPPYRTSTTEHTSTDQFATEDTKDNVSPQVQPNNQMNPDTFTPRPVTHKRFNSQEPEGIVATYGNANNVSTDSSVYQEYQTAEEETAESDEAPDVATTKNPSSNPMQAVRRTPRRRKAKNVLKSESIIEDATETAVESLAQAPEARPSETSVSLPRNPPDSSAEILTTGASVQLPLSPPPEGGPEPQYHHVPTDTPSTPAVPTAQATPTTKTFEKPTETPQNAPSQATQNLLPTTTELIEESQAHDFQAPAATLSTSVIALPPVDSNIDSSNNNSAPLINLQIEEEPTTRINPTLLTPSKPHQFTFPSSSSSLSNLPGKSRTTLSSHRRALLERRAQRSGGAFRLEASWAKKRRSFVV